MCQIGDIRELELRREDKWRDIALRVVCWLNAVEKERFRHLENAVSSPEEHDKLEMAKFTYFLDHFSFALLHIHAPVLALVYAEEYERVLEEYAFLRSGKRRCRPNGGGGSSSLPDPHTPPGMQPNPVLKVFSPAKNRAARLHGAPSHTQHPEVGLVCSACTRPAALLQSVLAQQGLRYRAVLLLWMQIRVGVQVHDLCGAGQ